MLQQDDSIYDFDLQLSDFNKKDSKKFTQHKLDTYPLANSFKRLGKTSKGLRVKECGTFLEFREYFDDNAFKLHHANFCKVRLCPMCAWRRSLKIFGQVSQIMDNIKGRKKFIFLTLTVKNCTGENLSKTIDQLYKGYKRLTERKEIKDTFLGWFRCLEVTYNKMTKEYHPHFHIILCAKDNYYKSDDYISQDRFCVLWRQAMRLDYYPSVWVEKVKNTKKAVCEVAKYTTKNTDYLTNGGIAIDEVVNTLDDSLAGRRLCAFGGIFKDIAKQLKLDDMENGDLVNTSGEDLRADVDYMVHKFGWHVGYNNYFTLNI